MALCPTRAVINDINPELTNLYTCIRDNVEELLEEISSYPNNQEFYYKIRELDRKSGGLAGLSQVQQAARTLYLNKHGFNGLYRVNSKGEFNVPYGRYKTTRINHADLKNLHFYLTEADIEISTGSYQQATVQAKAGDFVYFDPPYDPLTSTAAFTSYTADGFGRQDQINLKEHCDALTERGVTWLLSNSSTDFILDLYSDYKVEKVSARRSIGSKSDSRLAVMEVLVSNGSIGKN